MSKDLLADAGIEIGDAVEISADEGGLRVRPTRLVRGGHDLRDLVERIPAGYESGEIGWGGPAGGEVW